MPAFVDAIVQKIADAAPIENSVSDLVAGVLQNTANKLSRFDRNGADRNAEDNEPPVNDAA